MLAGAVAVGCPQPRTSEDAAAGGAAPEAEETAATRPLEAANRALLPPDGEVVVDVDGSVVDLRANESNLSDVLQALGRTAGFALDVGESQIEDRKITASIRGAPLFDVLSVVLRGVAFEVDVAFDPVSQQHRIARVRIRRDGAESVSDAPLADALADLLDSADVDIVVATVDALQRTGDARAIAELEPLLDDVDPAVRAAAERAIDALEESHGAPPRGLD